MSDLVTRLRETYHHDTLLEEAADRIVALEMALVELSQTADANTLAIRVRMAARRALIHSTPTCRAQKPVMQRPGKCGVTRRPQVPRRSFDMLAEGESSPRRMELLGTASSAAANDCNR
jgi:hypothetical protein